MNDNKRDVTKWAIYEVVLPVSGGVSVVALSLKRAVELVLVDDDDVMPGEVMIVGNHTTEWLERSRRSAEATWAILEEEREGLLMFDYEEERWRRWKRD